MKKFLFSLAMIAGFTAVNAQTVLFEDDFEGYDNFIINGIGDWTTVDLDGSITYGIFTGTEEHIFDNTGDPYAFMVFDPLSTAPPFEAETATAHDGAKYLMSMASQTPPNNDWIISPSITLSASDNVLSFWAKSYSDQYGLERFKVSISTTGTDPEDFTVISEGSYLEAPLDWTEYTYDLDAYAGQTIHFAINSVSNDAWMFFVDSVKVTAGEGGGPSEYCDLVDLDCAIEKINSVTFAGIENLDTGCGTAVENDYTDMIANVVIGETYQMTIDLDADPAFPDDNAFFFIDWNQNGTLDDAGEVYEVVMHTGTSGVYNVDVTVPADAVVGQTRLRVGIAYNNGPDYVPQPCPGDDGTLYGEYEDYTVSVTEGGGPGEDCSESTPSNNFENGHGNLHLLTVANDFNVDANTEFTADQFKFNVILPAGGSVTGVDVYFYEDTAGMGPGTELHLFPSVVPTSQDIVGNLSTFDVKEVVIDMDPTAFSGGTAGETYWVGVMIYTESANSYWEGTSILNTDTEGYIFLDGAWLPISEVFASEPFDGVYTLSGTCGELGVSEMESFDFAYYPNPVKDELNITSQKVVQSVSVYNLAGQQISTQKLNVSNGKVSTSSLPAGVYVFRAVLEGGQVETFKVIKK